MSPLVQRFETAATQVSTVPDRYAVEMVDLILREAQSCLVSDIHLLPQPGGKLQMLWRIDGVLTPITTLTTLTTNLIARLKVLAQLLTYRTDVPQEGRIQRGDTSMEMRVSTFPTLHGEKAVVRLFVASGEFLYLDDLGLTESIHAELKALLQRTRGVLLITGPAGSGKTTTLYACLRTILRDSPQLQSICTLEDPVEALIPGIAQSQVKAGTEFTYQRGLASLMRQDPNVIMVGEIRDQETAHTVFQASLTGQFVLTSFHAGQAAEALSRVSDMGIEPYVIRSGLAGVLAQRLVRKCCPCRAADQTPPVSESMVCPICLGQGYQGRLALAELLTPELAGVGTAILDRAPAPTIEELCLKAGMSSLEQAGQGAVAAGLTTQAEYYRVFGVDR